MTLELLTGSVSEKITIQNASYSFDIYIVFSPNSPRTLERVI